MKKSKTLIIGTMILVILACSGCVGGGSNVQTFDTNHGKIQFEAPETLEPTAVGSVSALGMLSLAKKGSGGPLITVTLTESNAYSNFENAVSVANSMPNLDERDMTTNDNHEMHWSVVNVAGFKNYEGIIDYVDDKGLIVDIKGLSDTTDPMSGGKISGFSENEYLDIFKSFKFVDGSKSQSTESQSTHVPFATQVPISNPQQTEPASSAHGVVMVAFRDLPILGIKNVGHVGVAFQNADGTWSAGAVEGPGFPFVVNALPGMNNGAWVEYSR